MSRPRRTRVYNANYDIGESLYRPALDRLDRKYSGRAGESPAPMPELQEHFDRAFADEDLPSARRRAEKVINENTVFDARGAATRRDGIRLTPALNDAVDNEFDEEITSTLRKIRDNRKKYIEDVDLEGTVSSLTARNGIGLSEKLLDSVGINKATARRIQNGESSIVAKRRPISFEEDLLEEAPPSMRAKWTVLRDEENSGAAHRAQQSRARLQDLEDEMDEINERQAARERRVKQLKAFMADNEESSVSTSVQKSSMKATSARISARAEKKTVTF